MVSGRPPWVEHGTDARTIMQQIATSKRPPQVPVGISDECRDFLQYCLIMDPTKRVTVDELFQHPFLMIADQESIRKSQAASSLLVNSLNATNSNQTQVQ